MAMATISSPMSRLSVASSPLNSSLASPMNKLALLSSTNTTLRQVDYDEDVTPLYEAIGNSEWDKATSLINSQDAATWVVRYERDAQGNKLVPERIQWRFLPIHSACALNPPASFLRKLVSAYLDGPRTLDDQGLLPLHYACGARCSRETIYCLLMNFPQAALKEDPNGMLPMHYLAQWGPDGKQGQMNMGVLDMVLVSSGDKAANCDRDGNTAERLAMNAEYDGHLDVAKHIASFLHRKGLGNGVDPAKSGSSIISSTVEVIKSPKYKNNRPVLKINVASPLFNDAEDEETVIEHAPEGNIETSLSMSGRENRSRNNTPRSLAEVQKQIPPSPISTPKSGRNRAFSWDDHGHNNNNNNNNENNNARDNFSISGSTWTTHLSTPPMSAPHAAVHRQMRPQTAFPPMSPRQAPPMSPRQFPPMSPRGQTGRVSTPKAKVALPQQQQTTTASSQPESRQDDESGRGGGQSFQSGSTNSTNYSSQLTQQLVEMAEMERREGFESPRANRASFVPTKKKNEKSSSDAILLEEIARLKAEKEMAEADLAKARGTNLGGMGGSFMGVSELSTIGEDEMSRLTTDDHELEQPIAVLSKDIGVAEMVVSPVGSEIARLEKERELIDIQLKKAREGPIDPEEKSDDEEVKDDYKLLFEKEQNEHISTKKMLEEERRKHDEEQNELISTKNMLEEERRKHGEDMQSHLYEVKSLRESLERATDEIAKHQSLKIEMQELQKKELDWDLAREKLVAEIKRLQEKESSAVQHHGGLDNSSVTSTLTNNSGLDNSVLKMQYENSVKEANDLRKFSAAMRKEHDETISELEGELERERKEKVEIMSNVVSMEYRISTLEDELEEARSNKSKAKFNSDHVAELEANLANESTKGYMLQQKVSTLEKDLEEALSHNKSKAKFNSDHVAELEANLANESSKGYMLQQKVSTLEKDLEEALSHNKSKAKFNSDHVAELEANLENESSKRYMLQQKVSTLEKDLEEALSHKKYEQQRVSTLEKDLEEALSHKKYDGDIDRMAFELHQLKRKLSDKLEEAEKSKDVLDAAKKEFERKEKNLKEQLDDRLEDFEKSKVLLDAAKKDFERKEKNLKEQLDEAQEQLITTVKQKHQDTGDAEESYLQKIRTLKMKIRELEEDDDLKSAKVREAEKVKLRTIQEKEDECIEKIRQLKKQYEEKLEDKEDEYFQGVRELKKKQEMDLTKKEESYLRDLRDAKKMHDEMMKKMQDEMMKKIQDEKMKMQDEMRKEMQDEMRKEMQDEMMQNDKMKDSSSEIDVNKMIEEKENAFKAKEDAFKAEVAKLTAEIDALRHESKLSETKLSNESDELEAQLLDCKSDLKSQGRKHRSEMNKLKNTLEMQKSKEVRLEGHIKALEKQIMSMTADYEERIQEYLYGNMDTA